MAIFRALIPGIGVLCTVGLVLVLATMDCDELSLAPAPSPTPDICRAPALTPVPSTPPSSW